MSNVAARLKGILVVALTASALCLVQAPAIADDAATAPAAGTGTTPPASSAGGATADSSSLYLQEIAQYTNGTLQAVNNLPTYLTAIAQLAISWLSPDTSDETAKLQATFAGYATDLSTSSTAQAATGAKMVQDFFGTAITAANVPYANDLDYGSLIGSPFFTPDPRTTSGSAAPDAGFGFIENAAAVNVSHTPPGTAWAGTRGDQMRYSNYYRTVTSVQTYDAYILAQLYTDAAAKIPDAQAALLAQASTSDWFAQVASEQIGIVLRQILMYNSQTYLMLSQLLQTEKQMLALQAMANSLAVVNGSSNESFMVQKAIQHVGM